MGERKIEGGGRGGGGGRGAGGGARSLAKAGHVYAKNKSPLRRSSLRQG